MGRTRADSSRPSRQRGVAAIWTALMLVLLVTATFLAIDVGRLYFTQRDLQRLAVLGAMAGAQGASGCSGDTQGKPGRLDTVITIVRQALISNGGDAALLAGVNGYAPVELGTIRSVDNLRVFKPLAEGDGRIDAVRVNLSRVQPTPFVGFLTGGRRLQASATAQQPIGASFTVGSTLLKLQNGLPNQLLGPLLCAAGDVACQQNVLGLNLASYDTGLFDTSVSLGQLATAAGLGVQDLSDPLALSTATFVPSDLLNGLAGELSATASSGVSGLLRNMAAAAAGNSARVPLGNLLGSTSATAGAVPVANLADVIMAIGAASKAAPDGGVVPIQLPLNVSVPLGVTVSAYLRVLQPVQSNLAADAPNGLLSGAARPGVATAHTSQVALEIRIQLANALLSAVKTVLSLAGADLLTPLNLGIDVAVAPAAAYLDALACPIAGVNAGLPIASLSASPALATVGVGTFNGSPTATSSPRLITRSAVPVATVAGLGSVLLSFTSADVSGSTNPIPLPARITQFQPQQNLPAGSGLIYDAFGGPGVQPVMAVPGENPQTVGTPVSVVLKLGLTTTSPALNGVLAIVQPLLQTVLDLVNGLAASLINPLLTALGVQTGTATVTVNAVEIGRPVKVSTCTPGGGGANACLIAP